MGSGTGIRFTSFLWKAQDASGEQGANEHLRNGKQLTPGGGFMATLDIGRIVVGGVRPGLLPTEKAGCLQIGTPFLMASRMATRRTSTIPLRTTYNYHCTPFFPETTENTGETAEKNAGGNQPCGCLPVRITPELPQGCFKQRVLFDPHTALKQAMAPFKKDPRSTSTRICLGLAASAGTTPNSHNVPF